MRRMVIHMACKGNNIGSEEVICVGCIMAKGPCLQKKGGCVYVNEGCSER